MNLKSKYSELESSLISLENDHRKSIHNKTEETNILKLKLSDLENKQNELNMNNERHRLSISELNQEIINKDKEINKLKKLNHKIKLKYKKSLNNVKTVTKTEVSYKKDLQFVTSPFV